MLAKTIRKYSTDVKSEKVITKKTTVDGTLVSEKINITQRWKKLSMPAKLGIVAYSSFVLGDFAGTTYNKGKTELLKSRNRDSYKDLTENEKSMADWQAVKGGCIKGIWGDFIKSCFFPVRIVSNTMPAVILYMNPIKSDK